jgi:hypothetical protein
MPGSSTNWLPAPAATSATTRTSLTTRKRPYVVVHSWDGAPTCFQVSHTPDTTTAPAATSATTL